MKWKILALVTLLAGVSLALTPQERQFAERARQYLAAAKEKLDKEQELLRQSEQEAGRLDTLAQGQQKQIVDLSGQIDKAHKNEESLSKYNAYAKPIIDQVNSHWGLGAFAYGFKILARHLFIAAIVVVVLGVGVMVLSFFFPVIGTFLSMVGSFLAAIFRRIGNVFKKK